MILEPFTGDPSEGLSEDGALDLACVLLRQHGRSPIIFWTADDGFQSTWGASARRIDPERVSVHVRRFGRASLA
jgi:hypothetical protein